MTPQPPTQMELKAKAKEILEHLIRNRFDKLDTCGLLTTGPDLIQIARAASLIELAQQMERDLKRELPTHVFDGAMKRAA